MDQLDFCFPSSIRTPVSEVTDFSVIRNALVAIRALEMQYTGISQLDEKLRFSPVKPTSSLKSTGSIHRFACVDSFHNQQLGNADTANLLLICAHGQTDLVRIPAWDKLIKDSLRRNWILLSCLESDFPLLQRFQGLQFNEIQFPGVFDILTAQPDSCVVHPIGRLPIWFVGTLRDLVIQAQVQRGSRSFVSWFQELLGNTYSMFTPVDPSELSTKQRRIQAKMLKYEGKERTVTTWDYLSPLAFHFCGNVGSRLAVPTLVDSPCLYQILFACRQPQNRYLLGDRQLLGLRPKTEPLVYSAEDSWLLWYPATMESTVISNHLAQFVCEVQYPKVVILERRQAPDFYLKWQDICVLDLYGTPEQPCRDLDHLPASTIISGFSRKQFENFLQSNVSLSESGFYSLDDLLLLYLCSELDIHLPKLRTVSGWLNP